MNQLVQIRARDGSTFELRNDVPATLDDCPTTRPCPHIHCAMHLWLDSHPSHAASPTGKPARPTRLLPRWLESPLPSSCALDAARSARRRGGMSNAEVAEKTGLTVRVIEQIISRVRQKARAAVAGAP